MTDNYYKSCLPLMSDGRDFTDWRSNTRKNEYIKYLNGIENNDIYRYFLQTNAQQLMDNEWNYYKNNSVCKQTECIHNYPTRMLPQLFEQEMNRYNSMFEKVRIKNECTKYDDYRTFT